MQNELTTYLLFTLKAIGFCLLWYVLYDVWIAPIKEIDDFLNLTVAKGGYFLLQGFGFKVCREGTSVCINQKSTVIIGRGCNGLEVYMIFAGFIMLYSGKWYHKLWYICIGIVTLYITNIVRVAMLAYDKYRNYHLFQFNHKYTYVFMMYVLVFVLWWIWIRNFGRKNEIFSNTH